jgi:hypothetical protein
MATTHYSFPTINGTDTIDGVNAINGLANAMDTALYQVEQEGGGTPGANSINTSMIQNGAVTTEKLNGTVQAQIQQGVNAQTTAQQALTAVNATPTSVVASASQGTIRAHKYGPLVVIQFLGTNMSLTGGANDVGTVRSNAKPAAQVEAAASLNTEGLAGFYVASDGRIGVWLYGPDISPVQVRASLVYFAGV